MHLLGDLRQGLREFRSRPWVSAVAVVTLGLGVAGATTMFAVISGIGSMMIPPGVDGARVGRVVWSDPDQTGLRAPLTGEEFAELRVGVTAFEAIAASADRQVVIGGESGPTVSAKEVSGDFFQVFGCRPSAGRFFTANEGLAAARVAVVSEALLRRHPDLGPGRLARLGSDDYMVVGVLPDRCWYPSPGSTDVWLPMPVGGTGVPSAPFVTATVRLPAASGITVAQSQIRLLGGRLALRSPAAARRILRLVTIEEDANKRMGMGLVGFLGPSLVVLLIACANVANLLLARGARREREMAIRAALGASRSRLVLERLTESAWAGLAGGGLGLSLAFLGVRLLRAWVASSEASRHAADLIRLDSRALLFAVLVTFTIPLVFGLVPALAVSKPNLAQALHRVPGRKRPRRGEYGGRDLLVIVEIGLAVVLVVSAGMFARFFAELDRLDWGFDASKVLTVDVSFEHRPAAKARDAALLSAIVDAARQVPGVTGAAAGELPGLTRRSDGSTVELEGCAAATGVRSARTLAVGPGYFAALGLSLRHGRAFTGQDAAGALPVAVISEAHARECWPGQDPVGRRLRQRGKGPMAWITIVGVVPDTMKTRLFPGAPQPVYVPWPQQDGLPSALVIRSERDPAILAKAIRGAVRRVDPTQPLDRVERLDRRFAEQVRGTSILTGLVGGFGAFSLALAALGVFSVTSYMVAERTREFGVRLALGASRRDVLRLVLKQVFVIVGIGTGVSVAGTLAVTRVTFREMADLAATDARLWAGVTALLALVAVGASLVPARRAMAVEPVVALRAE